MLLLLVVSIMFAIFRQSFVNCLQFSSSMNFQSTFNLTAQIFSTTSSKIVDVTTTLIVYAHFLVFGFVVVIVVISVVFLNHRAVQLDISYRLVRRMIEKKTH